MNHQFFILICVTWTCFVATNGSEPMEVILKLLEAFVVVTSLLDSSAYFTAGQVYLGGGRSRSVWPQLYRGPSPMPPFYWRGSRNSDYVQNTHQRRANQLTVPPLGDNLIRTPTSTSDPFNIATPRDNSFNFNSQTSLDNPVQASPASRNHQRRGPTSNGAQNKDATTTNVTNRNNRQRNNYIGSLLSKIISPQYLKPDNLLSDPSLQRDRASHSRTLVRRRERNFQISTQLPNFSEARDNLSREVEEQKQRMIQLLSKASSGDTRAMSELSTLDLSSMVDYVGHNQQLADIICRACSYTKNPQMCRERFCVSDGRNRTM